MIDLDGYRSPPRDTVAWGVDDFAVHPPHGIVRIADFTRVDGAMHLALAPVQVVRPLVAPMIPVSAAALHIAPPVDRSEATRLVALLGDQPRSFPPGDAAARRERCARTLGFGELPRLRLALHQLYAEPHRPAAADLDTIAELEQIVIGELALALGQPFETLRDSLREVHPRFSSDAPAPHDELQSAIRFELREGQVRAWGGFDDYIDLDAKPGWWHSVTEVPGFDQYHGVAIHESLRASLAHWLVKAKRVGTSSTEAATAFVESALDVADPAHQCEHFDPVDATIYGAGTWWSTGGDGRFEIVAAYEGQLAVLIAAYD